MKNNLNAIYEVLKKDSRLVGEDGSLLKNKIYELSMKMDSDLLKLLLSEGVGVALIWEYSSKLYLLSSNG